MTERDYINATNLAKIRIAETVVRDIFPPIEGDAIEASLKDILKQLQTLRLDFERRARVTQ